MTEWVHNDDPLEAGVRLPTSSINLWRKPRVIDEWMAGATLRDIADKYEISHETVRAWTEQLNRKAGASRRPHIES